MLIFLDALRWDLLADGTNFISVQVFDGSGNKDAEQDAFIVFKDTTPPAIGHAYDSQVWRSTHGFVVPLGIGTPNGAKQELVRRQTVYRAEFASTRVHWHPYSDCRTDDATCEA